MCFRLHTPPLCDQAAFRIQEKCTALDAEILAAVHVFYFHDSKNLADFSRLVTEEFEIVALFRFKFFMLTYGVLRHTEDLGVGSGKLGQKFIELMSFNGATGSGIFWVKIKDNVFTSELAQAKRLTRCRLNLEIGHRLSQARGRLAWEDYFARG